MGIGAAGAASRALYKLIVIAEVTMQRYEPTFTSTTW